MSKKLTFCEYCRKEVKYMVKSQFMTDTLKGEEYRYTGKKAFCTECHNEIFVDSISDQNIQYLYQEYRIKNNIISLNDIREIPEKYNIGKRPLSLVLGWGEQTYSRYYDGDIPTQQYSQILRNIYENPKYYLGKLEENKEKLSPVAYEKSKKATFNLLDIDQLNNDSKIYEVTEYMLYKCEDITPLALQKLLYYIQGFYFAFVKQFIFQEDCEAWVHGPVYKDIYLKYKHYRFDSIDSTNLTSNYQESLTLTEIMIIDNVIKHLSCYSGKMLERFTHSEIPWLKTRGNLSQNKSTNKVIDKELISQYFVEVTKKYNMLNPSDIGEYGRSMFNHID